MTCSFLSFFALLLLSTKPTLSQRFLWQSSWSVSEVPGPFLKGYKNICTFFQRSCFNASSPCREKPSLVKSRWRRILYLGPIFLESFVDLTPGLMEKTNCEILETMSSLAKHQQALGLRCLLPSTMCWKV